MKFKNYEFWQVKTEMFNLENWIKTKTKKKDLKCPNCKREYGEIGEKIALMTFKDRPNTHLCNECGRKYIELGAINMNAISKDRKELIEKIQSIKECPKHVFEGKNIDELKIFLKGVEEEEREFIEKQKLIEDSIPPEEDWYMEDYLKEQYNVLQDKEYLKSEYEIEEYFNDDYGDYFDCGQGYYEDEATVLVKIGKKFFEVYLTANIGGAKQDRGERLYWIEGLESVTYKEVDKPIKKLKVYYSYSIELSKDGKSNLDKYLKENDIIFKV